MNTVDDFINFSSSHTRNDVLEYERAIERMYRRKLFEMSVNRFKWVGLPDSIDPRFLEVTLFGNGLSVFYFDDAYLRFFALKGSPAGVQDWEDNPTEFLVTGNQFISKTLSDRECVPIWSNASRQPDSDIVSVFARRFAKIERTIEINTGNARQTRILVVDQQSKLSMENVNRQIDEGNPTIRVTQNMEPYVNVLDMGINPDLFEKLAIERNREWLNCMTLLGIKNSTQDKKERMVTDEVNANTEQTDLILNTNLNARKLAAKKINDRWGLQVDVHFDTNAADEMATVNPYDDIISDEFMKIMAGDA